MKKITENSIKRFKEYLINEEKSCATIEKYIRDISVFQSWLYGKALSKSAVLEYKQKLISEYAVASVNSILSSLNSFFDFFEEYALKVKMLKIQRQIFAKKDKELTKEEYERLLEAAKLKGNEKLFLLIQTICGTGIRVSELRGITYEALKKGQASINSKGKMRIVIIPGKLCKILLKYANSQKITSGSIFITRTGNPLNRSNIWKLMRALCESARVNKDKVFPHNLRHLFARTFYSLNNDIVRLADVLGHSSINTTRIYTMESSETHRRLLDRLELLYCCKQNTT